MPRFRETTVMGGLLPEKKPVVQVADEQPAAKPDVAKVEDATTEEKPAAKKR